MLRKLKGRFGESRYIGDLLTDADKMNRGANRMLFLIGGGVETPRKAQV